jgi:hypothetical protein
MILVRGPDAQGHATIRPVFSEPTTEEEFTMLRLRLAYLALASGVLMTLSGCASTNSCGGGGGMFPRLFRQRSRRRQALRKTPAMSRAISSIFAS